MGVCSYFANTYYRDLNKTNIIWIEHINKRYKNGDWIVKIAEENI